MCTVMLASNVNLPVYAREIQEVDVIEAQVNATETITLNKVIYKNYGTYYTVSGFEDGITQVDIPSAVAGVPVTKIDAYAFKNCTTLKSVSIPASVTSMGGEVFMGASSLESVLFHKESKISAIPSGTFNGATSLMDVSLPGSLQTIGSGSFRGCTALSVMVVPETVVKVGSYAFCDSGIAHIEFKGVLDTVDGNAFSGCDKLIEVNFVKAVKALGSSCFEECQSLNSVNFQESVTSIGNSCFKKCTALKSISIPEGTTTIEAYAFAGAGIKTVSLPNSLTGLGDRTFQGCESLESVYFGEKLSTLPALVFEGCTALTEVKMPEELTSIKTSAFKGCVSLKNVNLPEGLLTIENNAFASSGIESLTVPGTVKSMAEGALQEADCLKEVVISEGVTTLPPFLFDNCDMLETVHLPQTLTTISKCTFRTCKSLKQIELPESLTTLSEYAFEETALEELVIPDSVTSLGSYICKNNKKLKKIVVGSSITSIPENFCYNHDGLTEVVLPQTVKSIGDSAFYSCDSLVQVNFPQGLETIGESAFRDTALRLVELPDTVNSVGNACFQNSDVIRAKISKNLKEIPRGMFYQCASLKDLTIPEGVEIIGIDSFYGCNGVTVLDLPLSVTSLGDSAFAHMEGLTTVYLPSSVTELPWGLFYNCSNLKAVTIPVSVKNFGDDIFRYTGNNLVIYGEEDSEANTYAVENGISFYPVKLVSIQAVKAKSQYRVGEQVNLDDISVKGVFNNGTSKGVTGFTIYPQTIDSSLPGKQYINVYYLYNGHNLTSHVTVEIVEGEEQEQGQVQDTTALEHVIYKKIDNAWYVSGVEGSLYKYEVTEKIGEEPVVGILPEAFAKQDILTTVVLPEGITSIGNRAFAGCEGLSSIQIPSTVTSIGKSAFEGCDLLTVVSIPAGVREIGDSAFENCGGLESIQVEEENPYYKSIGDILYTKDKSVLIKYPAKKKASSYTISSEVKQVAGNAFGDCANLREVVIPNNVVSLGERVFANCVSLNKVTVSNQIKELPERTFENGKSLLEVVLEEGTTKIGNYCFTGCSSLLQVELPKTVSEFGRGAFFGCTSLTCFEVPQKITVIPAECFFECESLNGIVLNDGIKEIGDSAFGKARSMESVTISATVEKIGYSAFLDCDKLVVYGCTDVAKNAAEESQVTYESLSLTGIEVTKEKVEYQTGEKLLLDDLEVYACYQNGGKNLVTQYTTNLESIDMKVAGEKVLTITYRLGEKSYSEDIMIFVEQSEEEEPDISAVPTKIVTVTPTNTVTPTPITTPALLPTNTVTPGTTLTPGITVTVTPTGIPEVTLTKAPTATPKVQENVYSVTLKPTAAVTPTSAPEVTIAPSSEKIIVHFYNQKQKVYLFYFNVNNGVNTPISWPGINMVTEDDLWCKYTIDSADVTNAVFVTETGQTQEVQIAKGEWWFANGNMYDKRPVITKKPTPTPVKRVTATIAPGKCKVTFHKNGGSSVSKTTVEVTKNKAVGSLPTTKRNGYVFLGWYTKKTGGSKVTQNTKVSGNTTYYAHWLQIPKKPGLTVIYSSIGDVKLTWKKVNGAKGYVIYRSTKKNSGYKKIKTITSSKTLSYVDSGLKNGKTYYYYVKAYAKSGGKTVYSTKSSIGQCKVITELKAATFYQPKGNQLQFKFSWSKVKNATKYEIYMKENQGPFRKLVTTKGTSKTVDMRKYDWNNKKYKFVVVAVYEKNGTSVRSDYSKECWVLGR